MSQPSDPVHALVASAGELTELAQRLGERCLAGESELAATITNDGTQEVHDLLTTQLAAVPSSIWEACERTANFTALLQTPGVNDYLGLLGSPNAEYALLRALCLTQLVRHYASFSGRIALRPGLPYPLAQRPIHELLTSPATPHETTMAYGHLLHDTGFRIWRRRSTEPITVELDFSNATALDAVAWPTTDDGKRRLPRIATVHPYEDASKITVGTVNEQFWFDVSPADWDADDVISMLKQARGHGADIAILPELSLPDPHALHDAIRAAADALPPLIVCGSAHTTTKRPGDARYRANESVVLLKGREILRHEKTHAFRTRYLGAKKRLEKKIPEGITPGPKTLTIGCGDATRLAIVICADLNDQLIPPLLAESGANLVLVPALTAQSGAFIGSCLYVAAQNQGIAVVANGTPDLPEGYPVPFLTLVALPTSSNGADEYTPSSGQRRAIGLVDPGATGDNIVSWH